MQGVLRESIAVDPAPASNAASVSAGAAPASSAPSDATRPLLSVRGVSRRFPAPRGGRETVALEATDLDVAENDFITILGPSGCGKSTLLRIVAGLDRQTTGEVLLDGRRIAGPGADRGMVFQSYTLFPWLTVRDNVCFGLQERGLPRAEQLHVADAFIRKVGLVGFEGHYPRQLSGGMQQRTAIARALANGPRMLLMDEPFGALDALTRHHMQELLTRIWERHRLTVLFITHDVEEAVYMSDRVAVMSNRPGRIKEIIDIDLDRPRHYDMVATPRFQQLHRAVLDSIRAESIAVAQLGAALG